MDPVRFGRALGFGARAAAKTVYQAVDAATAPNPQPGPPGRPAAAPSSPASPRTSAGTAAPRQVQRKPLATAVRTGRGLREGARRFGRESWNPLVRLSGVLWLEFVGVFFGLFAVFAAIGAWRSRSAWHATGVNAAEHNRLLGALLMLAVFGYFCVSSFLRARSRSRRR